jgi:hypothetical protein
MPDASQSTGMRAKSLIHIETFALHQIKAIQWKPCADKQLAGVCIGFPQSYPQLRWTSCQRPRINNLAALLAVELCLTWASIGHHLSDFPVSSSNDPDRGVEHQKV